ncbi:MAG: hypothetical protein U5K56_21665 [Halioglobus sp.]|nr:hypothetical protein [Halioglobus sp.]
MTDKQSIEREALETYDRFVARRDEVDAGERGWDSMADFFTEDARVHRPGLGPPGRA